MDALTDVLTALRVESVCYGRLEVTAPWGLQVPPRPYAKFSLISSGSAWLTVEGVTEPILLQRGDFFMLAPEQSYSMQSALDAPVLDFEDVLRESCNGVIRFGGGGAPTTVFGGKFIFHQPKAKLIASVLPPIVHFRAGDSRIAALQKTIDLLAGEVFNPAPGSELMLSRLADVLLIQALRAHVARSDGQQTNWLRALSDGQIGGSLQSMHEKIEHPWTVASLATSAGMSRSAYALRFKELVGEAPLEYLTYWRMHKASTLLLESEKKLADVAQSVGYDSDGAFSKAFKRVLGVSPGEYRRNGNHPAVPEELRSMVASAHSRS
jgi:AraC-like DNA-binding protein